MDEKGQRKFLTTIKYFSKRHFFKDQYIKKISIFVHIFRKKF